MEFRVRPNSRRDPNTSLVEYKSDSMKNKLEQLEYTYQNLQEILKRDREITNSSNIEIQKRLDRIEYKVSASEQEIRQLSTIRELPFPKQLQSEIPAAGFTMWRQHIEQERESNRDSFRTIQSSIEQISNRQNRLEKELQTSLIETNTEIRREIERKIFHYLEKNNLESMRQIESYNNNPNNNSNNNELMSMLNQEIEKRNFQERDHFENRIEEIKKEILNEQKITLETEVRFMKETKISMQNVMQITNNTRQELIEEINETQKLAVGSIKSNRIYIEITNTIESIREKMEFEVEGLKESNREINNEIEEISRQVNVELSKNNIILKPKYSTNNIGKYKMNDRERIVSPKSAPSEVSSNQQMQQEFNSMLTTLNTWRTSTEQKNLTVFKEISNALKTMKQEFHKEQEENTLQIESLLEENKHLKKYLPQELKKGIQSILQIFNEEFETLTEELQWVTELINKSKQETEKNTKNNLYKEHLAIVEEIKLLINQKLKESNLQNERLTNKSDEAVKQMLEQESKYLTDMIKQKQTAMETQLNQLTAANKKSNANTNTLMEEFSLKIKLFNDNYALKIEQEAKENLKRKLEFEENIKSMCTTLIEINSKKNEYLIDSIEKNSRMEIEKNKIEITNLIAKKIEESNKINEEQKLKNEKNLNEMSNDNANKINEIEKKIKILEEMSNKIKIITEIESKMIILEEMEKRIQNLELIEKKILKIEQEITDEKNNKEKNKLEKEESVKKEENLKLFENRLLLIEDNQKKQLEILNKKIEELNHKFDNKNSELLNEMKDEINKINKSKSETKDAESISQLKESLWKIESITFSEQAKNKVLFDRLTEDVNSVSKSVAVLTNELKNE